MVPVEGGQADQATTHAPGQPQPAGEAPPLSAQDRFEQVLTTMCANARGDVHLDLAELQCVDATAVAALVRAAGSLPASARLLLHNPPETVVRILQLSWPDYAERGIVLS